MLVLPVGENCRPLAALVQERPVQEGLADFVSRLVSRFRFKVAFRSAKGRTFAERKATLDAAIERFALV